MKPIPETINPQLPAVGPFLVGRINLAKANNKAKALAQRLQKVEHFSGLPYSGSRIY